MRTWHLKGADLKLMSRSAAHVAPVCERAATKAGPTVRAQQNVRVNGDSWFDGLLTIGEDNKRTGRATT